MANLKCDAKNCIHNDSPYCCIAHICVEGAGAMTEAQTCCENFKEKSTVPVNSTCCGSHRTPAVDIECRASHCVYNENQHCRADEVYICGPGASVCDETQCSTFKAR